jgi:hypothetical protein
MVLIDHLAALLHPGTSLWGLHDSGNIQNIQMAEQMLPCRQVGQCKKSVFVVGKKRER